MLSAKLPKILKFFFLLTFLIAAVGLSGAQQALELPAAPDGTTPTAATRGTSFYIRVPDVIKDTPLEKHFIFLDVATNNNLTGTYIAKFRNTSTGVVQSFKIPNDKLTKAMNGSMLEVYFNLVETGILSKLANRTTYSVWGQFKAADGTVINSTRIPVYVARALPVNLVSPATGTAMDVLSKPTTFMWERTDTAKSYELRIIDPATGAVVYKQTRQDYFCEDANNRCSLIVPAGAMPVTMGKNYKWMIRTFGHDGAAANSKKWNFTPIFIIKL